MLTDTAIRRAKARARKYKRYDARGLYLLVTAANGRLWRFKYRYQGKERLLALGQYPDISLRTARERRDEARRLLATGIDPRVRHLENSVPSIQAAARSFEAVAREWWSARKASERWDEDYAAQVLRQLERDVFPIKISRGLPPEAPGAHLLLASAVGEWPFEAVRPPDVLELCKNVEARGSLDAARDLRSRIGMVYRHEKVLGRCMANPAEDVAALLAKPRRTNHAALTYQDLPAFFARFDAEDLEATTRLGLEGVIATWLRSTELRLAGWQWLNWRARELRIPPSAMKNGDKGSGDHIVPLSDYAMNVFDQLHAVTGHGALMFPSLKHPGEPISDGAWLNTLYRMGYRNKATVHGIRALGSTTANEAYVTVPHVPVPVKMWEWRWIDRQLDHVDSSVSGCYNRAEYLEPRRALMQWWGEKVQAVRVVANPSP
ncbi:MAG: integrase arm-type DNA-binding domain-containing protein [Paraburkholderia sp.]|uniref:tyrosine-type recombinase/integrase n=1 Tax=Paraburkholderia sp. TaxID=1926495 RepID=UPI003C31B11B